LDAGPPGKKKEGGGKRRGERRDFVSVAAWRVYDNKAYSLVVQAPPRGPAHSPLASGCTCRGRRRPGHARARRAPAWAQAALEGAARSPTAPSEPGRDVRPGAVGVLVGSAAARFLPWSRGAFARQRRHGDRSKITSKLARFESVVPLIDACRSVSGSVEIAAPRRASRKDCQTPSLLDARRGSNSGGARVASRRESRKDRTADGPRARR